MGPAAVTGTLICLFVLSLSHSPPSSCLVPSSVPGVGGAGCDPCLGGAESEEAAVRQSGILSSL